MANDSIIVPLPPDYQPHPYDVLIGRGKGVKSHNDQNPVVQLLLRHHINEYIDCTKERKGGIISHLVSEVQKHSPGGGFVKLTTGGTWSAATDLQARMAIAQCLRNREPDTFKSSKHFRRQLRQERRTSAPQDFDSKAVPASVHAKPKFQRVSAVSVGAPAAPVEASAAPAALGTNHQETTTALFNLLHQTAPSQKSPSGVSAPPSSGNGRAHASSVVPGLPQLLDIWQQQSNDCAAAAPLPHQVSCAGQTNPSVLALTHDNLQSLVLQSNGNSTTSQGTNNGHPACLETAGPTPTSSDQEDPLFLSLQYPADLIMKNLICPFQITPEVSGTEGSGFGSTESASGFSTQSSLFNQEEPPLRSGPPSSLSSNFSLFPLEQHPFPPLSPLLESQDRLLPPAQRPDFALFLSEHSRLDGITNALLQETRRTITAGNHSATPGTDAASCLESTTTRIVPKDCCWTTRLLAKVVIDTNDPSPLEPRPMMTD